MMMRRESETMMSFFPLLMLPQALVEDGRPFGRMTVLIEVVFLLVQLSDATISFILSCLWAGYARLLADFNPLVSLLCLPDLCMG